MEHAVWPARSDRLNMRGPAGSREKLDGWLESIRLLWPDCPAKISSDGTSLEVNRAAAVLVEWVCIRSQSVSAGSRWK